jgi:hypothetical protein
MNLHDSNAIIRLPNKYCEQRLAVHAAEQQAHKPNARPHGSKPNVGSKKN